MRVLFCGNFEYGVQQSTVERLFRKFGKLERVDLKAGYAFIHMLDERDAENAIKKLDGMDFGRKGQPLRVEWTRPKPEHNAFRRPDCLRRYSATNTRPSKTLFVVNFDPINTRTEHIERHFEQYGRIASVRRRRHFAFVEYELLDDAARALEATHMSKLMDHTIHVEFAMRHDDDIRSVYCPNKRWTERFADAEDYIHPSSPSPYHRGRSIEQMDRPDHIPQPVPNPGQDESSQGCRLPAAPIHENSGQLET